MALKIRFVVAAFMTILPTMAWASDCNNPGAVAAAQTALLNAYGAGGDNPNEIQISNVESNITDDGTLVCMGKVATASFITNAAWTVGKTPMGWDAEVIMAIDPQHFVSQSQK